MYTEFPENKIIRTEKIHTSEEHKHCQKVQHEAQRTEKQATHAEANCALEFSSPLSLSN